MHKPHAGMDIVPLEMPLPIAYAIYNNIICIEKQPTKHSIMRIPFLQQSCRNTRKPGIQAVKGDVKLLFVPLIFLLLRIWSTGIDVAVHFTDISSKNLMRSFLCSDAAAVFMALSVGLCLVSLFPTKTTITLCTVGPLK